MKKEVDLLVEELPLFIEKYGRYPRQNCGIVEEETLANRVSRVRKRAKLKEDKNNYKVLTKEDIQKLQSINFIFDATRKSWLDIVVENLPKFVAKFGRYPDIRSEDEKERKFARIIYNVRKRAKMKARIGLLNPYSKEELKKLEDINFLFDASPKSELDIVLDELPKFVLEYGRYPSYHAENLEEKRLAKRIAYIRQRAKIDKQQGVYKPLTKEDKQMLDDIYFAFDIKDKKKNVEEFLNNNML